MSLSSLVSMGPSPRIRGECGDQSGYFYVGGTIPANTGRMPVITLAVVVVGDHPREYGENSDLGNFLDSPKGPSPRIRGESQQRQRCQQPTRTIPANTGRIGTVPLGTRPRRDHPREYGENPTCSASRSPLWGPSPRIRGEFSQKSRVNRSFGTIPANTGRILFECPIVWFSRDHPREYGENLKTSTTSRRRLGPSPRIRGESHQAQPDIPFIRTIPANTGRMLESGVKITLPTDHPREYGENNIGETPYMEAMGPSPRIRGESFL